MTVSLKDAHANFSALIRELRPGSHVVVTDNGKTVATIMAPENTIPKLLSKRVPGLWKDKVTILSDDNALFARP